jgi:hypothetical protein
MNLRMSRMSISITFAYIYLYILELDRVESFVFGSMHDPGMVGYVTVWFQSSLVLK